MHELLKHQTLYDRSTSAQPLALWAEVHAEPPSTLWVTNCEVVSQIQECSAAQRSLK